MVCLKSFLKKNRKRTDTNRVAMVAKGFDSPCHPYFLKFCHIQEAPIKDKWSKAVKSGFLTHSEGFNSLLRSKEQGLFRIGLFWRGEAWSGKAVMVRYGLARLVMASSGKARQLRFGAELLGSLRCVPLWFGLTRQSR